MIVKQLHRLSSSLHKRTSELLVFYNIINISSFKFSAWALLTLAFFFSCFIRNYVNLCMGTKYSRKGRFHKLNCRWLQSRSSFYPFTTCLGQMECYICVDYSQFTVLNLLNTENPGFITH